MKCKKYIRSNRLCFRVVFMLLLCAGCRKQPSDVSVSGDAGSAKFRVAFYNVENLFDDEYDGREYPEYRPEPGNWSAEMHKRKLENIASVLYALDASIVALCEVEDQDALRQLQAVVKKKGKRYPFSAVPDTNCGATTMPMLLSVFPVKTTRTWPVSLPGSAITRPVFETVVTIGKQPVTLFINHWPSKHHQESYRVAAGNVLASRLKQLPEGTDYIILGDFNSEYAEFATFGTTGHDDTRGRTGINQVLGTVNVKDDGTITMQQEELLAGAPFPSHYNLWLELTPQERISYFFRGNRQTPDHILLPVSLYDATGISYVDNSFSTFTWNGKLLSDGIPRRWKMRYSGKSKYHIGEGYSDHLPIVASFTVGGFNGDSLDFSDALLPEHSTGWFEEHSDGWVASANAFRITRDTAVVYRGTYALHLQAPAQKRNKTAIRSLIKTAERDSQGTVSFFLQGSGSVCFRTRVKGGRWRYFRDVDGKPSGQARYTRIDEQKWRRVVLDPGGGRAKDVEVELRCGKGVALDVWIDK